jgi:hypothetical protein
MAAVKRLARIVLWIYLIGFVLLEFNALFSAYRSGAFGHIHSASDFLIGLAESVAINALWPIILIIFLVQGPPN